MSGYKRFGLRIVLWVASVLLQEELTAEQREDLENIRTHLTVTNFED